jgi:putative ABC transport system ATP-binding protein
MANDPPILVADEPTGSLDSATAATVLDLFAKLVEGGTTVLLVTHDRETASRGSRIVKIADGAIGPPERGR